MGARLQDHDEYTHEIGPQSNWNESRYINFWDPAVRVGGWFRIGNRPNEGHAEMSAAINLPDGRHAFMFCRAPITGNGLSAGGQSWTIDQPWRKTRVAYEGEVMILDDPWCLTDPKKAFTEAPRLPASVELTTCGEGLDAVMGFDQDHIDRIFLPGQADFHYQRLIRTEGRVTVGDQSWTVAARGGMDHSWGPRNWHAKIYLRWLIASFDDDHGFMLVRAVGPTKQTRSGFVWDGGKFHLVEHFDMDNEYAAAPHYEVRKTRLRIRGDGREWTAVGTPQQWLPLRHRQKNAAGEEAILRIVKSPTEWVDGAGRKGAGMLEYHDLIDKDGRPHGLHE